MTIEEELQAKGVTTIAELEAKIQADADAKAKAELEKKDEQIQGLEAIKEETNNKLADMGREIEKLKPQNLEKKDDNEGKKMDNEQDADAAKAAEAKLKEANEQRKAQLSDDENAKLVQAYEGLDPEVQTLVDSSEEGFASFADEVLGTAKSPLQKTFRPPVAQVKLSIADQIKKGLGTLKSETTPRKRPLGMGASITPNKTPRAPAVVMGADGGLLSAVQLSKQA